MEDYLVSVGIFTGIAMIASGFAIGYFGRKKGMGNTWLWASFPIFHGVHELLGYVNLLWGTSVVLERFMLWVAFGATLALLAALLEYNGAVSRPYGKIFSIFGFMLISYFLFLLPEESIETTLNTTFHLITLHTDLFRFFYGFFLIMIGITIIWVNYFMIKRQGKAGLAAVTSSARRITIFITIFLVLFALFEGFDSENDLFIGARAISLAFFLIIPLFVVFTGKLGLQQLLIIHETGHFVFGFNFNSNKDITNAIRSKEFNEAMMTAGLLSAISSFFGQMTQKDKSFVVQSHHQYFSLLNTSGFLVAMQSISSSRELEKMIRTFSGEIIPVLHSIKDLNNIFVEPILDQVQRNFRKFL